MYCLKSNSGLNDAIIEFEFNQFGVKDDRKCHTISSKDFTQLTSGLAKLVVYHYYICTVIKRQPSKYTRLWLNFEKMPCLNYIMTSLFIYDFR